MTAVRGMRASDEDRQRVIDFLRDAHVVGRLQPDEFYQRLDAAYAATTWGELDDLIADLPHVWNEADLPAGLAVPLGGSRAAGQHPLRRAALTCALVLAIGLLAGVATTVLWAGCLLVLAVLLLPLVPGCGQRATPSARGKLPSRHRDLR